MGSAARRARRLAAERAQPVGGGIPGVPVSTLTDTGIFAPIRGAAYADDPLRGTAPDEHVWTINTVHRVREPERVVTGGELILDSENVLSVIGPFCWRCEDKYSPDLAARPCPGEPEGGE